MWFDSHCHLHLCEDDAPVVVERARLAGVLELLTVGIDVASSVQAVELAKNNQVYASVGVHPNSAMEWNDEARVRIQELLDEPRVVAVGETGLDFYRDRASPDLQRDAFRAQIDLAKSRLKTLVIHTRESVDEALDVLAGEGPPDSVIFHCWSGDAGQLKRALELGSFISFAGNVSFKNATDLRRLAAIVPEDRLLVETDSPFLTPMPHRGKPNEPRHVAFVGVAVAEARSVGVHDLAELTTANSRRAFRIAP